MPGQPSNQGWAIQQIAGFLAAITSYPDVPSMVAGAAHRIAEAVDAEVCVLILRDGRMPVAIGFPVDEVPHELLADVLAGRADAVHVDGLGGVRMARVALESNDGDQLVLGRSNDPLTPDDLHLVRSMLQVLQLAVGERRTADRERVLREQSDRQAEQLREANEALLELSAAKDTLISVASHELRTPLTSILGFANTMRQHDDRIEADERARYLEVIERQGQRLLRLVDDLLTVGRLESGATDPQPTNVIVSDAAHDVVPTFEQPIAIRGSDEVAAFVDRDHFDQLLLNLATNAIKYGAAPIAIETTCRGTHAEVAVIDHGPGVPEEFVPKLFERFTQASTGERRESSGTGLGLAIVAGLAEANGGDVRYERSGGVTRFVVRLPSTAPADSPD